MPNYTVRLPNGDTMVVEGPPGATDEQIIAAAQQLIGQRRQNDVNTVRRNPMSRSTAMYNGIEQVGTAGFADELAAAANAIVPLDALVGAPVTSMWTQRGNIGERFGRAFQHNQAYEERRNRALRTAHPVSSGAGDTAGLAAMLFTGHPVVTGGSAGIRAAEAQLPRVIRAIPGAPVVARVAGRVGRSATARGAVTGATYGAAAGFGGGDTLHNRTQGAGGGALLGALTGGPLGFVTETALPTIGRYIDAWRGRGATEEALRQLRTSLTRAGYDVTSPQGRTALDTFLKRHGNRGVTLADTGTAPRTRTGVALRTASDAQQTGRDVVTTRQGEAGDRLRADVYENVAPQTDVHALDEALVTQRRDAALPARRAAVLEPDTPAPVIDTPTQPVSTQTVTRDPNNNLPVVTRVTPTVVPNTVSAATHPPDLELPTLPVLTPENEAIARNYIEAGDRPDTMRPVFDAHAVGTTQPGVVYRGSPTTSGIPGLRSFSTRYEGASEFGPVTAYEVPTGTRVLRADEWGDENEIMAILGNLRPLGSVSSSIGGTPVSAAGVRPIVPDDPILQGLARNPLIQRGLHEVRDLATAERDYLNTVGEDTSHIPTDFTPGAPMDMSQLDFLKRYLDGEINRAYAGQSTSFNAAEGQTLKNIRNAIRLRMRHVGESAPGAGDGPYARYLDQYSDQSEMLDALRAGRGQVPGGPPVETPPWNRQPPEAIAAAQAERAPPAQELYRVGVARNLTDRIDSVADNGNPARAILQNPAERARLAATGANATGLGEAVGMERNMAQLSSELNDNFDARQAARQDVQGGLPTAVPYNPGSPLSYVGAASRAVFNTANLARDALINEQLLPRILEQNPAAIQRIIDELVVSGRTAAATQLRNAQRTYLGARAFGTAIGGPVSIKEYQ